MNKKMMILVMVLLFLGLPLVALGADFDGSKPLLCAFSEVIECGPGRECQRGPAENVNLPAFVVIDFKGQVIKPTTGSSRVETTAIKHQDRVDGKLILQGAEDGRSDEKDGVGWTVAVDETTGKLVLTASGEGVGFMVFGACTQR